MLMKPRRWLAYTVTVNDLLPCYEELITRFEQSEVPLDSTFGSNTEPGCQIPGLLVAFGPAVEPQRLEEVVSLLAGLGKLFLVIHHEATHSKCIVIGALNLEGEPVVAMSESVLALIRRPDASASDLCKAVAESPRVHPFAAGEQK
jgi:hypothetical protein